jgi:hypothetical protein
MANYPIGVTKNLNSWHFQQHHVERMLDNSPYDAATPEDTLILAGPARKGVVSSSRTSPRSLMAVGQFTSFAVSSQASLSPMMAIGSGRSFFLRGKSQSSWQLQRVLMNGRNLLRALYHNAVEAGIEANKFDDPAAVENTPGSLFFCNLDSELFYIPVGLAVIMRTKSRTLIGALYLELCLISSWGLQFGAGQTSAAESVSGLCDRVLPYLATDAMDSPNVGRALMDAVLGLAGNVFPEPRYDRMGTSDDSGQDNPGVDMLAG